MRILCLLVGAALVFAANPAIAQPASGASALSLPEGPGKATTQRLCSQCHTLANVTTQHHNQEEWNGVISRMMEKGLTAGDDELQDVSDYLTKYFGPQKPSSLGGKAPGR
jgi:cytochrome c5